MPRAIQKLLSISSEEIAKRIVDPEEVYPPLQRWNVLGRELADLLLLRNGFWAYESCLLVRPLTSAMPPRGLTDWNNQALWKGAYALDLSSVLFFAEDVFGEQHCLHNDLVRTFDPETGELENLATSLEEWASVMLDDYEYRTGYPLGHEWQTSRQPLEPGKRLLPRVPFVLGGKFELENLYMVDEIEGMRARACVANQIRDVPDGGKIVIELSGEDG